MNILKTSNLKKYYGNGENLVKAIDNANIDIKEGEFVAIVGKSGSIWKKYITSYDGWT